MKTALLYFAPAVLILGSCTAENGANENVTPSTTVMKNTLAFTSGYSQVNGINMYYEIYGQGKPLVLLHGGGSTIQSTFGNVIPLLAQHRQLICVELQAHGRTSDRDAPLSFEQDADDVRELLKNLNIQQADIFGFSNGGNTALLLAINYPEICNKVIAASALLKRDGAPEQFWTSMKNGTFEQMPQPYKDAFLKVTPDSAKLVNMYRKCAGRMITFKEFSDEQLTSIRSPVLLINGTEDVASPEHVVAMSRLIPDCRLAIIPGGHGAYIGEITTIQPGYKESEFAVALIEKFLNR